MKIYNNLKSGSMKLEDIIELLNQRIEELRATKNINTTGHLVLQRTEIVDKKFKSYVTTECILWYVKDRKKYKVLSAKHTLNISGKDDKEKFKIAEENLLGLLIGILLPGCKDLIDELINGTYHGFIDKSEYPNE